MLLPSRRRLSFGIFFMREGPMERELSIFCDESGGMDGTSKYRLVSLVFHDQADDIASHISCYQQDLLSKGLEDIPFHASPLMYGKPPYDALDIAFRRRMFASFSFFQRKLPFRYVCFAYKRSEVSGEDKYIARLRRDLVVFLSDNLDYFHSFGKVKIYYDGGQQTISNALHAAFEYELSKEAILYRNASPKEYRLSQVADYLCTLELTALKFDAHEITSTDEAFFGLSAAAFKRDYLKKARKKLL